MRCTSCQAPGRSPRCTRPLQASSPGTPHWRSAWVSSGREAKSKGWCYSAVARVDWEYTNYMKIRYDMTMLWCCVCIALPTLNLAAWNIAIWRMHRRSFRVLCWPVSQSCQGSSQSLGWLYMQDHASKMWIIHKMSWSSGLPFSEVLC